VQLFIERGQAARPDFSLTDSNAPAVASICHQLDGIPLAIELAAARLRLLGIEQINERLSDRFRLLTGGSRTAMPRQQTLQAAIDWSFNLLSNAERLLFQRLSVFSGGWTLDSAELVCSGNGLGVSEILDLLTHLVDKSLVRTDFDQGEARYRMLESIRQYAWRGLAENEQAETWQRRHLEAHLALAEQAEPLLRSGEDLVWLARLAREHDNLRTAIEWALASEDHRSFLRMCAALNFFWIRRGHYQEGRRYLQLAEDLGESLQYPLETARALVPLGLYRWLEGQYQPGEVILEKSLQILRTQGAQGCYWLGIGLFYLAITRMRLNAYDPAMEVIQESLAIFEALQDTYGLASSNYGLGRIYIEQGDMQAARQPTERALEWGRRCGDRYLISLILDSLVLIEVSDGNYARALEHNWSGLQISRELDDPWLLSAMLREAGNLAQIMGELPEAIGLFKESNSLSSQLGLMGDYARTSYNLGVMYARQGEHLTAETYLTEALALFKQLDNRRGQAECLDGFALLAYAQDQPEKAAALIGAADAEFACLKIARWPADLLEHERLLAQITGELEPEIYAQAQSRGVSLSLDEAIDLVLQ
jgi:tetratricopeptide (TPR) repeat protein